MASSMGGHTSCHVRFRLVAVMEYVANLSCGKDSLAMVLGLMERGMPLTKAVMYDTGMEFQAIYHNLEKIESRLKQYECKLKVIRPESSFLMDMLIRPVCVGTEDEHYGYEWCGGCTRWRTSEKVRQINKYLSTLGDYKQYVGIAFDEAGRIRQENNKVYPLVDWQMQESDCLAYCYRNGFDWKEDGIELYEILDRVSCWCCANKNLKELRNMYHYLPKYWGLLKGMQYRIKRPFYKGKYTIFQLEERFRQEDAQMTIFDYMEGTEV